MSSLPMCSQDYTMCNDGSKIRYWFPIKKLKILIVHLIEVTISTLKLITYEGSMCWVFQGTSDCSYYCLSHHTILKFLHFIMLPILHIHLLHLAVALKTLSVFWFVVQEIDSHRIDYGDQAFIWTWTYVFLSFILRERH